MKETAVLHWKSKPALIVAIVSLVALFGACVDFGGQSYGFYW